MIVDVALDLLKERGESEAAVETAVEEPQPKAVSR